MEQARDAAQAVTEFFQGNPFQTVVGRKVEEATDSSLPAEDWSLNLHICDLINARDEGPKEAVRAIRRRLQTNIGRNNVVVMYTLTVLETCVKNCDFRFHHLVSQKDFVNDLLKIIGPKFDPPQNIQDRVLGLIKSWADAFRDKPELSGVCEVYDELKAKGIEFPKAETTNSPPIFTPHVSAVAQQPPAPAVSAFVATSGAAGGPQAAVVTLAPEQLAKLRSELDVVNGNLAVFREMLSELHPGAENADDLQLLQNLHSTCLEMQERIVDLVGRISSEEVTSELLVINDELNNVFSKYDRYMKNRDNLPKSSSLMATSVAATITAPACPVATENASNNLIDFSSAPVETENAVNARIELSGTKEPDKSVQKSEHVQL